MTNLKTIARYLYLSGILLISACDLKDVTVSSAPSNSQSDDFGDDHTNDSLDGFNRSMMEINFFLDDYLLQPAATAYKALTPQFVQTGVGNFTQYISIPFYMVNDILQGELDHFAQNFWVFGMNTISGFGLINTAGYMGVYAKPNDFGITLHQWGLPAGSSITLPVLGPTCFRDMLGSFVGFWADPVTIMASYNNYLVQDYAVIGLGYVHSRSLYLGQLENLRKEAYDPYMTIKNIIEQKREADLKEHQ